MRLSWEEYQRDASVNWSTLSEMRRSPLHYRHRVETAREDTDAMRFGRAAHCAVLEPDEFPLRYVVASREFFADRSLNRATKEGKDRWAAWLVAHPEDADLDADGYKSAVFRAANPGRDLLSSDDYRRCLALRDAVRSHPEARKYLDGIEAEVSVGWRDPTTQIACKGRLDGVKPASHIVDLKTSRDIETRAFSSGAHRLGYHCQLAHYQRGWAETHGGELLPVVLIAVEALPPHDVAVYLPNEEMMLAGCEELDRLLALLAQCRASGKWPGRYVEPVEMQIPAWAVESHEMEVTVDGVSAEF